MLSDWYLYFYEENFINNNVLLYRYIVVIILFSLNDNQYMFIPVAFLHNIELTTTNLTDSAVNFLYVSITILLNKNFNVQYFS